MSVAVLKPWHLGRSVRERLMLLLRAGWEAQSAGGGGDSLARAPGVVLALHPPLKQQLCARSHW